MTKTPNSPIDNATLDAAIEERARSTDFGALLASEGVVTFALDEDGRLTEYQPDGTTRSLD